MDNYIYNCFDKTIYDYLNENLNDINISFIKIKDLSIIKNKDDLIYNENGEKIETFIEEFKNNNKNDIDITELKSLDNYTKNELENIASNLDIPTFYKKDGKRILYKKEELYLKINENLNKKSN